MNQETNRTRAASPDIPVRYKIIRLLGEGGLGKVYLVADRTNNKKAALKILGASRDRKLENEFFIMAQLRHPGFIQVYDYGVTSDEHPFFTMEYFPGKKLDDLSGRLSEPLLTAVLTQICTALHYIHSRGFVHCDLKPGNILVREHPKPRIKILDFGLTEKAENRTQGIRGTPGYIAPEILKGQPPDPRSDLYSLGIILYELISGAAPFSSAQSELELLKLHLYAEPPEIAATPWVPVVFIEITRKLIKKNPGDRLSSAEEILDLLKGRSRLSSRHSLELTLPESEFIGRTEETEILDRCLREFQEGRGLAVFIEGEEGIGKSRLASEFRIRAELQGSFFLELGSGSERTAPFKPIRRLIKTLLNTTGSSDRMETLIRRLPAEIRIFLPKELTGGTFGNEDIRYESREEKFRIFEILSNFISSLLRIQRSILLFENVGKMDAESLEFLRYSTPSFLSAGALLLFLQQPEEATGIEAALDEKSTRRIGLKPFMEHELSLFLSSKLGPSAELPQEFSSKIHTASGGNPLFAGEIVRHIVESGLLARRAARWKADLAALNRLPLPRNIREIIQKKVAGLSPKAKALLRLAALVGDRFELEVLRQLAFHDLKTPVDAETLGELLRSNLLRRDSEAPDNFAFYSGLVREAVLRKEKESRKDKKLHRMIAEILETRLVEKESTDLEAIAHHYGRGGNHEKALQYYLAAAKKYQAAFALSKSLACVDEALLLRPKGRELVPLQTLRGDMCALAGENAKAVEAYKTALSAAMKKKDEQGETASCRMQQNVELLERLAKVLGGMGHYDLALKKSRQALRLREKLGDEAGKCDTLSIIGRFFAMKNEYGKALQVFQETLEIRNRRKLTVGSGYSLLHIGNVHYFQGNYMDALGYFQEALSVFEGVGDLKGITTALDNLGIIYSFTRDFDKARGCLERSLEINKKMGNVYGVNSNYNILGRILGEQGDLRKALHYQSLSLETNVRIGDRYACSVVYNNIGETYRVLGNYQQARASLLESLRISEELKDKRHKALVLCNLGFVSIEEKKWDEARRCLQESLTLARSLRSFAIRGESLLGLSQLALENRELETALTCAEEALCTARSLGDKAMEASALRVRGSSLGEAGNLDRALEESEESEKIFRDLAMDYELGRTLHEKGRFQAKAGRKDQAAQSFQEARGLFLKIGAKHYLARTLLEKGKLKL